MLERSEDEKTHFYRYVNDALALNETTVKKIVTFVKSDWFTYSCITPWSTEQTSSLLRSGGVQASLATLMNEEFLLHSRDGFRRLLLSSFRNGERRQNWGHSCAFWVMHQSVVDQESSVLCQTGSSYGKRAKVLQRHVCSRKIREHLWNIWGRNK